MSALLSAKPLRPYQARDLQRLRAALARFNAALYIAPTGAGKTRTFCEIADSANRRQKRLWIVVHRQELLSQTSRDLDLLGIHHGVIAPGFTPDPTAFVQIAMVQTLAIRIAQGRVGDVDMIVFDEAHHAVAGSWRKIRNARPKAKYLGVTATPERLDGEGLGDVFEEMIVGPSTAELMDDGYLCRAEIYCPPIGFDLAAVAARGGDYVASDLASKIDKPTITGDAVEHYTRICPRAPAIVFCASVKHAEHVAEQFRAAGYAAESIDGDMHDSLRRQRIADLGAGRLHVLTSCDIISEGTDIPVVACAILLRATQSLALFLQQVGRALRPVFAPGFDTSTREGRLAAIAASMKPAAIVLDHVGNTAQHGYPDDPRAWSLDAPKRSKREKRDGGGEFKMKQCPKCYRSHRPAPICPNPKCGHVYRPEIRAPEQVVGQLEKLTEDDKAKVRAAREEARKEVGRARTLDALIALGRQRGYRPEWAHYVFAQRSNKQRS